MVKSVVEKHRATGITHRANMLFNSRFNNLDNRYCNQHPQKKLKESLRWERSNLFLDRWVVFFAIAGPIRFLGGIPVADMKA